MGALFWDEVGAPAEIPLALGGLVVLPEVDDLLLLYDSGKSGAGEAATWVGLGVEGDPYPAPLLNGVRGARDALMAVDLPKPSVFCALSRRKEGPICPCARPVHVGRA